MEDEKAYAEEGAELGGRDGVKEMGSPTFVQQDRHNMLGWVRSGKKFRYLATINGYQTLNKIWISKPFRLIGKAIQVRPGSR